MSDKFQLETQLALAKGQVLIYKSKLSPLSEEYNRLKNKAELAWKESDEAKKSGNIKLAGQKRNEGDMFDQKAHLYIKTPDVWKTIMDESGWRHSVDELKKQVIAIGGNPDIAPIIYENKI